MARKSKAKAAEEKEPPFTMGEPTEENPSGLEAVSEDAAKKFGKLRDTGGPGAAGCTVAGPIAHVATEGGEKPLPVDEPPAAPAEEEKEEETGNED